MYEGVEKIIPTWVVAPGADTHAPTLCDVTGFAERVGRRNEAIDGKFDVNRASLRELMDYLSEVVLADR